MRERRGESSLGGGGGLGGAGDVGLAPGRRTRSQALQRKADGGGGEVAAPSGGAGDALPVPVLTKMEDAFGFDFGAVRVHEGGEAPSMGAVAYTQGTDVHFAPGQYDPHSERGHELIGHELAHVVQQSEGRVGATRQFKGVELNDDPGLEHEADTWGSLAARGEQVSRGGSATAPTGGSSMQRKVVQRAAQTSHWGTFTDTTYALTANGCDIVITFEPGAPTDATKIGLSQTVKTVLNGATSLIDPSQEARLVTGSGPGAGSRIDRLSSSDNPIYGSPSVGTGHGLGDTAQTNAPSGSVPSTTNATFELGHHYTDTSGPHTKNAWLSDGPSAPSAGASSSMTFETTALAIEGAQAGEYYGSVKWGWERDGSNVLKQVPFEIVSQGVPSAGFLAAATAWNSATARGTLVARQDPTNVCGSPGGSVTTTIPKDTPVTDSGAFMGSGVAYRQVTVGGTGTAAGTFGYIRVSDLRDQGDGAATVDLPVPDVQTLISPQTLNDGVPGPWRDFAALPIGTRVVETSERPGGDVPAGKVWVRVVDGPSTGQCGYVDRDAIHLPVGDFPNVLSNGDTAIV